MISNLPILFANGKPTSLEKMSMYELECFITFLVHCSFGHDTARDIDRPLWWPTSIPFSNPFIRPSAIPKDWISRLKELVTLCYKHHCSEFLLKFCEDLAKHPPSTLQYVKHCDSTTSLYLKASNRLLVTFRNENMLYDRPDRKKNVSATRKCLLPYKQKTKSVDDSEIDIFLCDTCDEVFESLEAIKEHEKTCFQEKRSCLSPSPSLSTDVETVTNDQDSFLQRVGLCSVSSNVCTTSPAKSEVKCDVRRNESRQKRIVINGLTHYPFSSPAGIRITKTRIRTVNPSSKRDLLDRYCTTSVENSRWLNKFNSRHYPVRYKKPEDYWTRYQTFPRQRKKLILDVKSQLLYLKCKPSSVILNRLTDGEIKAYVTIDRDENRISSSASNVVDNDIEFVSHEVLPERLINKRKNRKVKQKKKKRLVCKSLNTCSEKPEEPCAVIDLCSDDEERNQVSSTCCTTNNNVVNSLDIAETPEFLQPLSSSTELEGAQYHINVQSLNLMDMERDPDLDPLDVNVLNSHANNVISLD